MALVTDGNRALVELVLQQAITLARVSDDMVRLLQTVQYHISSDNTAPGAGDTAEWDGPGGVVEWYAPLYQEKRQIITTAHTALPVI